MILKDAWDLYNQLLKSSPDLDLIRKILAFNEGQKYLLKRMIEMDCAPEYLISDPIAIASVADQIYVTAPDDLFILRKVWQLSGTSYVRMNEKGVVRYDELVDRAGNALFDTAIKGYARYAAVKLPNIYLDRNLTGPGSDDLKVEYWIRPTDAVLYDTLNVDDSTGFMANDTVTGDQYTADVYSVASGKISIDLTTATGAFTVGETISNGMLTAVISSITPKPQSLSWLASDFKMLVAECAVLMWLHFNNSDETESRSFIIDNMINNSRLINSGSNYSWGFGA